MASRKQAAKLPPIDKLVEFIESCSVYFRRDPSIRIPNERVREFQMTFGCCMQTIRYAESFLAMSREGFSNEAGALARAALEHAATVEYSYMRVDGLDQLCAQAEETSRSLIDRMNRWDAFESPLIVPPAPSQPRLPRLTSEDGIFQRLDPC